MYCIRFVMIYNNYRVKNIDAPDGSVAGCQVTLMLPLGLKTVHDLNAK